MQIYNNVKLLRQRTKVDGKKLSQQKLADIVGLTRSRLAEFESFNGKISADVEGRMMEVFGLSDRELLYRK